MDDLKAKALRLRELHHVEQTLLLPNVWDVQSARTIVDAGFPVVATTSEAIADLLGYEDGEHAPAYEMFRSCKPHRLCCRRPVSVDGEAGYGLEAGDLVDELIRVGAGGCNIEDSDHWAGGLLAAEERATYIARMREAAERRGVPLVINARVDVFRDSAGVDASAQAEEAMQSPRRRCRHLAGRT